MVAGTFQPPREDQVKITDGMSCGLPAARIWGEELKPAE